MWRHGLVIVNVDSREKCERCDMENVIEVSIGESRMLESGLGGYGRVALLRLSRLYDMEMTQKFWSWAQKRQTPHDCIELHVSSWNDHFAFLLHWLNKMNSSSTLSNRPHYGTRRPFLTRS